MNGLGSKVRTLLRLGPSNLMRVATYRAGLRSGLHPVQRIRAEAPAGPYFFSQPSSRADAGPAEPVLLFSRWSVPVAEGPPDWLSDPLTGARVPHPEWPWWQIPDFDAQAGDIKRTWELSRMDWAPRFAQRAALGEAGAADRLEQWISSWVQSNPPYRGPNWKCGQEASIRVMNLAMASLVLKTVERPTQGLLDLIEVHLRRIAPTIQYAVAQDNNHGTSEAAALFVGGSWLADQGRSTGERWERIGRRWLEDRARRLISPDGGFSQYSLNYHRLMLDTLSICEVWRRRLGRPEFSAVWQARARAATDWLRHLINAWNGDGPNVGANDGARLLHLTDTGYRDHRPTVQLAAALFFDAAAFRAGPWEALTALGVETPTRDLPPIGSQVFDDVGFAVLARGDAKAVLRYPRFRFRPSQADALHVDLWIEGENLLRDGGSCTYADADAVAYFSGVASHNTIQFDGRDQMPRLGRFLFADWLETSWIEPLSEDQGTAGFGAGYRDAAGAGHRRQVRLSRDMMTVIDAVDGFSETAILRWRLAPGDWRLQEDCTAVGGRRSVKVTSTAPMKRCEIVAGRESRHYLDQSPIPVLEVEVDRPCELRTEVSWLG